MRFYERLQVPLGRVVATPAALLVVPMQRHHLVSIGIMDSVLVHPPEVFRTAIAANASALVLMHNHPSGEVQPSEADIRVTRDLIRAGQLLKLEVINHVIVGNPGHCSLRSMGYFY